MIIVVVLKHVSHHVLCGHSKRLLIIVLVNREKKGLKLVGVVCGDMRVINESRSGLWDI
jgi:hypothetical protein